MRSSIHSVAAKASAWFLILLFCHGSHAAVERRDPVAAEALFQEALKLMDSSRIPEACPKFEESQRLDPAVGTLMYLALCYERTGRSASAWSTYRMAASAARNANQSDRERIAKERADALEPKLSRLVLRVSPNPAKGLVITRDGVVLGQATWGLAVPVDPGKHQVDATAPNRKRYSGTVDVPLDSAEVVVDVPTLDPIVAQLAPASGDDRAPQEVRRPTTSDRRSNTGSPLGTQHWVGIGVGALGVAGIGLGTFFAFRSRSFESEAEKDRKAGTNGYYSEGYALNEKALDNRDRARLSFALGGAALACGTVLFLAAPKAKPNSAGLRLHTALSGSLVSLTLEGGWQ